MTTTRKRDVGVPEWLAQCPWWFTTLAALGGLWVAAQVLIASQFVNLRHAGFGVDATRWPKLAKYIERIHGRPSFKTLIEEEAAAFRMPPQ